MKKYYTLTYHNTFRKKQFRCIVKDERIILYNIFGFGLWITPFPYTDKTHVIFTTSTKKGGEA